MADLVDQRLGLRDETLSFEIGQDALASFVPVQSLIRAALCRDPRVFINDADPGQIMTLSHFKVRRVVGRCDLHSAAAKCRIHDFILNERKLAIQQWQDCRLTFVLLVALIFRVDGNSRVSEHRFRPGCCDLNESVRTPLQSVSNVIELRIDGFVDYLEIRQGGVTSRTPVDQAFSAIDQPFVIQADENFTNSARQACIKSESLARPVARRSDPADLLQDDSPVLLLPLPDSLDKFLSSEIMPC